MTTEQKEDRQKRLHELLKNLKQEIFVELDKRIGEVEESLSEQVTEQVSEQVLEQVVEQVSEQVSGQMEEQIEGEVKKHVGKWKKANMKLREEFGEFQENFIIKHKIPYAFMVISGIVLFWYGAWGIIRVTPVLNNGLVALLGGVLLLFITGAIYKKLIG